MIYLSDILAPFFLVDIEMHYVILGGGVAGVACLEELLRADLPPGDEITLISASPCAKAVANYLKLSDVLESFDLTETPLAELVNGYANVKAFQGVVSCIDSARKNLTFSDGRVLSFDKLCICAGAAPRLVLEHPLVLGLRDMQSIDDLTARLRNARRVAVIGNGGIALSLVHEITSCDIVWAVRDGYIGSAFFDASASAFFLSEHAGRIVQMSERSHSDTIVQAGAADTEEKGEATADTTESPAAISSSSSAIDYGRFFEEGCCGACSSNVPISAYDGADYDHRMSSGGQDGSSTSDAAHFNYHDDRPHPSMLAAARGSGSLTSRGAVGNRMQGTADNDDEDANGPREIIPVYAPLPQRERRGGRRAREGREAKRRRTDGSSSGGVDSEMAENGSVAAEVGVADATAIAAAACAVTAYGSSVGPAWVAALRQRIGQSAAADLQSTSDESLTHASKADPSQLSAAPPSAAVTPSKVSLETRCELVAIRGSGPAGAVGVLADGRWHSVGSAIAHPSGVTASDHCTADHSTGAATNNSALACLPSCPSPCPFPLHVRLSNGHEYGCDFVVSATGVLPLGLPPALTSSSTSSSAAAGKSGPAADVTASLQLLPSAAFLRGPDGGLIVNKKMQAISANGAGGIDSSDSVYVAGDAASISWPRQLVTATDDGSLPLSHPDVRVPLWFQMRLWNQARQQGIYAARCMAGTVDPLEEEDGGLAVEIFAHATKFLGLKVVLLGLYNGQGLGAAYEAALRQQVVVTGAGLQAAPGQATEATMTTEGGGGTTTDPASSAAAVAGSAPSADQVTGVQVQLRVTPGQEYIKLVLLHGRVVGAMLIGETDLEETMENLILNRIRVTGSSGGASGSAGSGTGSRAILDLLHPDVDIEDYFD